MCKAFLKFAAFQGTRSLPPCRGRAGCAAPPPGTGDGARAAPRRRTPATLPVRLSKSWSLTSNGADSIRWGRRPPEPRSLCPSCRLLPGLPRNPGSPRLRHAQPGTHHGVAPRVPPASDVAPGIQLENKRWSKPKTYRAKRHVAWVLSNEWLFFLISSWFSKLHLKTMKWHKEATE